LSRRADQASSWVIVGAVISATLKHVDVGNGPFDQDTRHVGTKRAKIVSTWFFPVGHGIHEIIADWVSFLRTELGFGHGPIVHGQYGTAS
jgi:hypothetical protein